MTSAISIAAAVIAFLSMITVTDLHSNVYSLFLLTAFLYGDVGRSRANNRFCPSFLRTLPFYHQRGPFVKAYFLNLVKKRKKVYNCLTEI
jgi:hypothetical protein